jgi:hypothetical protein
VCDWLAEVSDWVAEVCDWVAEVCDWLAEKLDRETGGRGDKGKGSVQGVFTELCLPYGIKF